jgi:hypothetical protein
MVTLSLACALLLSASPDAPLQRGAVLTEQQLWEQLQDPNRSIFKLPRVGDPRAVPRLPDRHPELEALRDTNAKLRPLRLGAATIGGGLMLTAGTYLASVLLQSPGQQSTLLPSLYFGTLIALPLIPFAVTRFGNTVFGSGTWVSTLAGTLVGYFGSLLVFTFATEISRSNRWGPQLGGFSTRDRGFATVFGDRIGTTSPHFVPMLAAAPLLGAVIGYELSSHSRISAPMGPRHPVLPLSPRVMAPLAVSF